MSRFKNYMLVVTAAMLCLMVVTVLVSTSVVQKQAVSREGYISYSDKKELKQTIGDYTTCIGDWGEFELATAADSKDSYVVIYTYENDTWDLVPSLLGRDGVVIKSFKPGTKVIATDSFVIQSGYTQDEDLAKVCSMKGFMANGCEMAENSAICDYFAISPDGDYLALRTGWGESKVMRIFNRDMEEIRYQELPVRELVDEGTEDEAWIYDNFFFPEAYVPGHLIFEDRSAWTDNSGPGVNMDINLITGEVRLLADKEFEREEFLKLTDEEMAAYLEQGYCIYQVGHAFDYKTSVKELNKYLAAKHHKELKKLGLEPELLEALLKCEDAQLMAGDFVLVSLDDEETLIKLKEASYEH